QEKRRTQARALDFAPPPQHARSRRLPPRVALSRAVEQRQRFPCASYNAAMAHTFDICIRGGGIVGNALALLLARDRLKVALLPSPGPKPPVEADVRAYALNAASRRLLESLRSWPDAEHATAVRAMRVHGDQDGAVCFDAAAHGVEALAWIVDVPAL